MPVALLDETSLFFTDSDPAGAHAGPALLLVHGWTCDSHDWSFQHDAFAAGHRVIAVDLRGHGRSSAPDGRYTAQRYAADLALLLGQLGTGPVVVVGHSLGGSVAAALCVEHPHLVRASVVVEPAYGQPVEAVEWMRAASEPFATAEGPAIAAALQAATEPLAPAWQRTWHCRRALGMSPALLAHTFHEMYFADDDISGQPHTDPYLARREVPVLAFHRLPPMAQWEAGVVRHPYSHVVSWEGSGHWLHQERVTEFNALVLAWVAGLPHDAAPAELVGSGVGDAG